LYAKKHEDLSSADTAFIYIQDIRNKMFRFFYCLFLLISYGSVLHNVNEALFIKIANEISFILPHL